MADETEQQKKQRPVTGGTTKELVVSTGIGLFSGLIAMAASVRREFNEELNNWPGMKGPNGINAKYEELLDKCDIKFEGRNDWAGHVEEKAGIKAARQTEINQDFLYKRHSIVTEGVRGNNIFIKAKDAVYGTYQRLRNLGQSNKRLDVWFKGASIATIIGVGVYNLLTSIATRKKAREIENLILDKVLEEPAAKAEAAHRAMHDEPSSKVSQVASNGRLQAANEPELAVRA